MRLGKTIGELADLLTEDELMYWREFHMRYPLDDLHRVYRPAALMYSGGFNRNAGQAFTQALDILSPRPKKQRKLRAAKVVNVGG